MVYITAIGLFMIAAGVLIGALIFYGVFGGDDLHKMDRIANKCMLLGWVIFMFSLIFMEVFGGN